MLKRWLDSDSFWKRTVAIQVHLLAGRLVILVVYAAVMVAVSL